MKCLECSFINPVVIDGRFGLVADVSECLLNITWPINSNILWAVRIIARVSLASFRRRQTEITEKPVKFGTDKLDRMQQVLKAAFA